MMDNTAHADSFDVAELEGDAPMMPHGYVFDEDGPYNADYNEYGMMRNVSAGAAPAEWAVSFQSACNHRALPACADAAAESRRGLANICGYTFAHLLKKKHPKCPHPKRAPRPFVVFCLSPKTACGWGDGFWR